jgi:uncharacterized membrane protein YcaP (DUF421 family)
MHTIIQATCVYFFLLVVVRVAGRRTMAELSAFDLVLLLIISETTQNALTGDDPSLTTAVLAIVTLVGWDVILVLLRQSSGKLEKFIEGTPLVLVREGRPLHDRLKMSRVKMSDILCAARLSHGLVSIADVRYAILESDGQISVVPKRRKRPLASK